MVPKERWKYFHKLDNYQVYKELFWSVELVSSERILLLWKLRHMNKMLNNVKVNKSQDSPPPNIYLLI